MRRVCVRSDFSASNRFWVQRFKPLRHLARDDFTRIFQTFSRALVRVSAGPMVPVPVGIAIYLVAMTTVSLLSVKLASVIAEQAIVVALPHLNNSPPNKLSLIEQRRIEAMLSIQPLSEDDRKRIAALAPPDVFAGRLDFIQRKDLTEPASPARLASAGDNLPEPASQPSSITTRLHSYETRISYPRKGRGTRSSSRYADVTARDIFNRSFGVLSWRSIE